MNTMNRDEKRIVVTCEETLCEVGDSVLYQNEHYNVVSRLKTSSNPRVKNEYRWVLTISRPA